MTEREAVALVTGAGRGIGAEVVRQLATAGWDVVAGERHPTDRGHEVAEGGRSVRVVTLDITDAASVAAAVTEVGTTYGRLDALVNNAAAYVDWGETASGADLAAAAAVMETNLYGTWRVTQAFLPLLRASDHPRVVMVSSGAGSHADPDFGLTARGGAAASYGITKAAVNALVSTLAAELSGTGVLVNAVCPGLTATYPGAEEMGARPVQQGAAGIVAAVTLPDDGPSGAFLRDGEPLDW